MSGDPHKEFVGRIGGPHDGYDVFLVDGEDTRAAVNNDLTGGGNPQAYPGDDPVGQHPNRAVPEGELWIERGDPRSYLPYLMHELIEALRMRYAHEEYKVAHLWASQAEGLVRRMQRGDAPAGNVDVASVLAYKAVRDVLSARGRSGAP